MADEDRVRNYLRSIGQGTALESMNEDTAANAVPDWIGTEQQRDAARSATVKLARNETLERHERFALEAIIIPDKRPAVLIERGTYTVAHQLWQHLNAEDVKTRLEKLFPSIGRIELPEHPSLPYGGTGFVVGPKLLMTNRHVAEIFSAGLGTHVNFRPGGKAGIDFKQEHGTQADEARRIDIRRVMMIHPYWDMALLEVEGFDAASEPLELSVRAPEDYMSNGVSPAEVAVVGYPAFDPRNNPDVQNAVFGGVFNVKRLQPGFLKPRSRIDSFDKDVDAATHDASTLGGNSGSAVIDIATGQLVGLHFAGRYLEANYAVPTSDLASDARVVDAGVNFRPTPAPVPNANPYKRWWAVADQEFSAPDNADKPPSAKAPPPLQPHGSVTMTIPLQITVSLGDLPASQANETERSEADRSETATPPPEKSSPPRDRDTLAEGPLTFRDHFLSLYQSIAEDVARKTTKTEGPTAAPDTSVVLAAERVAAARFAGQTEVPAERSAFETLTPVEYGERCASLAMQMLQAKLLGDHATLARLKGELQAGKCDPAWAGTIEEYVKYFGPSGTRNKPLYVKPGDAGETILPIKSGCRIGLIGDWGTGAGPARRLLGLVKAQKPDVLIHLGDIYYSGTPEECAIKFEAEMASAFGPKKTRIPIFTLAGNHDMYCGGVGYYGLIARLNGAPFRQNASFFCLRSEDASWQIVAMDTGQHDYSPLGVANVVTFVEAEEQTWMRQRVAEFAGRTILMSHHQLFSAFSQVGPKDALGRANPVNPLLAEMFKGFGQDGERVAAWFWGHEHNLCIYEPYAGLARGRCLGHSAVPVFVEDDPYETLQDLRSPPKIVAGTEVTNDGRYYRHGFAMLTLGPAGTCHAEYFEDRDGVATRTYSEPLS